MTTARVVIARPPAPPVELHELGRRGSLGLGDLVDVARRDNPRRALLTVSKVLGKHVPTEPSAMRYAAAELARIVRDRRGGAPSPAVIAMAETATGLGLAVAEALDAPFVIHTTRRPRSGRVARRLVEEHSHAPDHLLYVDPRTLASHSLVVVDDEATSGRTIQAVRECVERAAPNDVVGVVLVDARPGKARDDTVIGLVDVLVVAVEPDPPAAREGRSGPTRVNAANEGRCCSGARLELRPTHDPAFGLTRDELREHRGELTGVGALLVSHLQNARVVVIGLEEDIYAALVVAEALTGEDRCVMVQSTTRSPIHVSDRVGYPFADRVELPSCTDPAATAFIYDLAAHVGADLVVVGPAVHVATTAAIFRRVLPHAPVHEVALS